MLKREINPDKIKHLFSVTAYCCKQIAAAILGLHSQLLHSLLIGTIRYVHSSLLIAPCSPVGPAPICLNPTIQPNLFRAVIEK